MSATLAEEFDAFSRFVTERLGDEESDLSLEESVQAYREYQSELARFLVGLEESRAQAERGEAAPLDVEAVKQRVRARLAQDANHIATVVASFAPPTAADYAFAKTLFSDEEVAAAEAEVGGFTTREVLDGLKL